VQIPVSLHLLTRRCWLRLSFSNKEN